MHFYEYLFAAIAIVMMMLASSLMIATLTSPQTKVSETELLKVTGEKIMNQILFDPGDPPEWGSNHDIPISQLHTFGLAKYNETTRGAYVLDSDKIIRLSNATNTDKALRSLIPNLLNLGKDYGIALEFTTPLNVNVTLLPNTNDVSIYDISVTSRLGGLPVYGATVISNLYYVSGGQIVSQSKPTLSTDATGNCQITFAVPSGQTKTLVVSVDYSNIHVLKVHVKPAAADPDVARIGGEVYSSTPLETTSTAIQIIVPSEKGNYTIKSLNSTIVPLQNGWYQLSYSEPATVATLAMANGDLVCAKKDVSTANYTSISVDFSQLVNPVSYTIDRTVKIDELTYSIRLYIWRMSY
jgi:hypothetical protein